MTCSMWTIPNNLRFSVQQPPGATGRLLRFLSDFPSFFAFIALFVFFLAYQYDFRYDGIKNICPSFGGLSFLEVQQWAQAAFSSPALL